MSNRYMPVLVGLSAILLVSCQADALPSEEAPMLNDKGPDARADYEARYGFGSDEAAQAIRQAGHDCANILLTGETDTGTLYAQCALDGPSFALSSPNGSDNIVVWQCPRKDEPC